MSKDTVTFIGYDAVIELLRMMFTPDLVEKFLVNVPEEDVIEIPIVTNSFGKVLVSEAENIVDEIVREMYSFSLTSPKIKSLSDIMESDRKNLIYIVKRKLDRIRVSFNPK